jgi:hypothetical protein
MHQDDDDLYGDETNLYSLKLETVENVNEEMRIKYE